MRTINMIVIHCSATKEGKDYSVMNITWWHKKRGFRTIGYHFLIHADGTIDGAKEGCRSLNKIGAHAKGKNLHSVGICYIGGKKNGKAADTRTVIQTHSMRGLVKGLQSMFPDSRVVGHRDLSVDLNGDGIITKSEWMKDCPCFDVKTEL